MNTEQGNTVEWHWELYPGPLVVLFRRLKEPVSYTKDALKEAIELLELENDTDKKSEEFLQKMKCLQEGMELIKNPPKEPLPHEAPTQSPP